MKTLAESFTEYLTFQYPLGLPNTAKKKARAAFHAGALTTFKMLFDAQGDSEKLRPLLDEAKKVCDENPAERPFRVKPNGRR